MGEPLSDSDNALIRQGGNNPPPDAFKESAEFQAVAAKIRDHYDEAKNWADGSDIDSEAMAEQVTLLFDTLGEAKAEADKLRKALVEPYDKGKAVVQAAFNPLIGDTKTDGKGLAVLARESLNAMLAKWRTKEAARKEAIAKKLREDAAAEAEAAQAKIRESAGNLEQREEAEKELRDASRAVKVANRATTAASTGTGLVRRWRATELTDLNAALRHYYGRGDTPHRDEFAALVMRLAQADATAGKRDIPGVTIEQEAKAR